MTKDKMKKIESVTNSMMKMEEENNSKLLKRVGTQVSVGDNLRLARKQAMGELSTNIVTTEVEDKTVDGYFSQITHNFYIGKKAVWYMCRDIADAMLVLNDDDKKLLKLHLENEIGYSSSKVRKLKAIGEDKRLQVLESENVLPEDWTTLYELTTLDEKQFDTILPKICEKITKSDVLEVKATKSNSTTSNSESKTESKWFDTSFGTNNVDFIRISFDKDTSDIIAMQELVNEVKTLINKFNASVKKPKHEYSYDGRKLCKKFNIVGSYNEDLYEKIAKTSRKLKENKLKAEVKTVQEDNYGISCVEDVQVQTS